MSAASGGPGRGPGERRTLDRLLSRAGAASRAQARRLVAAGRVSVDGRVVRAPDAWVDPLRQRVLLDEKPLQTKRFVHLLLHKPAGVLVTARDPAGRRTVYDLLGELPERVVPVGRLDRATSGLLLLSNDTDLADAVTDPASGLPKTYLVKAEGLLDDATLGRLAAGVGLQDGPTLPARVERQRAGERRTWLTITITEGRNRQVRRMLEAVGSEVLQLKRLSIGPLTLDGLASGRHRALSLDEERALRAALPAARGAGRRR